MSRRCVPQAGSRAAGRPGRLRTATAATGAEPARLPSAAAGLVCGPRDPLARPPSAPQSPAPRSRGPVAGRPGAAAHFGAIGCQCHPPYPASSELGACRGARQPPCVCLGWALPPGRATAAHVFVGNHPGPGLGSHLQSQKLTKRTPFQVNLHHPPNPGAVLVCFLERSCEGPSWGTVGRDPCVILGFHSMHTQSTRPQRVGVSDPGTGEGCSGSKRHH